MALRVARVLTPVHCTHVVGVNRCPVRNPPRIGLVGRWGIGRGAHVTHTCRFAPSSIYGMRALGSRVGLVAVARLGFLVLAHLVPLN